MAAFIVTLVLVPSAFAAAPAAAHPAGCTLTYTVAQHARYATRAYHRHRLLRRAVRHASLMALCQQRYAGRIAAQHLDRRLRHWRRLYLCDQSHVVNCIRAAARRYHGDFAHALSCARSESGLNPYAYNAGGSGATGEFQFMPSTYYSTLSRMGVSPKPITSAEWQARAALWKFAHDGYGEWSGAGC